MTEIEIRLKQAGDTYKVTWIEEKGESVPQELWTEINIAVRKAVEKYNAG